LLSIDWAKAVKLGRDLNGTLGTTREKPCSMSEAGMGPGKRIAARGNGPSNLKIARKRQQGTTVTKMQE